MKDRGKPRYINSANLHYRTKHGLYNNPTSLEFNQATPTGPTGWAVAPPRANFLEFPLISVNSRKLFGAHG